MDDPAALCASVRSLASRSYDIVRRATGTPDASSREVAELLERIARLERQMDRYRRVHKLPFEDLRRWISSLRRRIESLPLQRS